MPFQMQARSSSSGELVTWLSDTPDFAGEDYPGPGSPLHIVVASRPQGAGSGAGANVGSGVAVFKDVSGGALRHRTLKQGTGPGPSFVQNADEIEIRAVPPDWYNVMDYGAVGDGTTDDTAAINAAIAAANAAGGGIVYLPGGSYKVTEQLTTLGEGVWLRGVGWNVFGNKSTRIHSYVYDTLLYLGEHNDTNYASYNGVEGIYFECKVDQSSLPTWGIESEPEQINVNAAARTFTRTGAGSFIVDGFVPGMRIKPTGFTTIPGGLTSPHIVNDYGRVIESVAEKVITVTEDSVGASNSNPLTDETGDGDEQITTAPEVVAGACIEARGSGNSTVRNCAIQLFPMGIVFDGTGVSRIVDCNIGAGAAYGGFQEPEVSGKGIWLIDGGARGRGWTVGVSANANRIHRCEGGGYKRWIEMAGALGSIEDCYSLVFGLDDVTAYYLTGTYCTHISRSSNEGYAGANNRGIEFGPSNLNVSITQCYIAATEPIRVPTGGAVSGIFMAENQLLALGGVSAPAIVVDVPSAFTRFFVTGWAASEGSPMINQEVANGISLTYDGDTGIPVGLGVNKMLPAQAGVDMIIADNTKPLFRVYDSTNKTYYEHSGPTRQKQNVNYQHTDAATGHQGGGLKGFCDLATMTAGAGHVDLASWPLPAFDCLIFASFTVQQWREDDPTLRGLWRCSQMLRQVGGTVTFEGALIDDMPADDTGGHTHPTLEDTTGAIAVRVYEHATETTRATVVCNYLVTVV